MKAGNLIVRSGAQTIGLALLLGMSAAGLFADTPKPVEDLRPHAVVFRQMRYGIFIHNVYGLTGWPDGRKDATLDEFADAFDVKAFADQMERIGVEYVYFTAWHKAIYNLGPNRALDQWLPGHTSKRDLIGEIADALHARDIRLVIYAHPNDAHDLTQEEQERIGFAARGTPGGKAKLNDFINEVYGELAKRYATKPNVLGFWWDSWWAHGGPIDMPRLRKTTLARFPGAITLSNKYDPMFIDFYSHEGGGPPSFDKMTPLKDNQTFFLLGDWWSSGPNASWYGGRPTRPEDMYRFELLNVGTGAPGGMTWALSPLADGKTWPGDNEPLRAMQKLGKFIAPVRPTICNVLPSHNWVLPSGTRWPDAPAFVAARSPDHKKEYVHVLKPPEGRFIDLPKPVESFKSARLYTSKRKVAMSLEGEALRLTLPDGEAWDALDTVIELTVKTGRE